MASFGTSCISEEVRDDIWIAEFSSYRSYLRAKKEEDRLALLKVIER